MVNVVGHINGMNRKKKHVIASTDTEKSFNKIQHPFVKTPYEPGIEGTYLSIIKAIKKKKSKHDIYSTVKG